MAASGCLRPGTSIATTVTLAGASGYQSDPALPFFLERYAEAYRRELDTFVASVLDGAPIAPSGEDGLKAQLLADAATQAAMAAPGTRLT